MFKVGDRVAPEDQLDTPGMVVEVKDEDGTPGYVVEWDDGLEDSESYSEAELTHV